MNNSNKIKLVNENGVEKTYGEIHDLWHLATAIEEGRDFSQFDDEQRQLWSKMILDVWHMAHDLKSVVEGQGQAKLTDPAPAVDPVPEDMAYVIELAQHRADQWSEFAMTGAIELDEFYECDNDETKDMIVLTQSAVEMVRGWYKKVRS